MTTSEPESPSRLRVGQAAEMLGVSVETLRRWEAAGILRMERSDGGQRLVAVEEVSRLLGSPSTVGTFDQERWFYVSQRNEVMSFYKADITKQDVVAIDFDGSGVVSDVHTHGLELAQAVQPDPNKTRTLGNELTFVQQVLGNIGRFNTTPSAREHGGPSGGF